MSALEIDDRLAGLVSPLGGVIARLEQLHPWLVQSADTVTLARLGEVGLLRDASSGRRFGVELDGIGCDADPEVAARIAMMEALERYAAAVGDERRWVTGSVADLGPDAIDLGDAARCASSEFSAPGFPLTRWDPTRPLRWVRGWSLVDGREVWVPVVMAHLGVTCAHPVERFWLQTSSGCAAGETVERALMSACLELIERDAVAIAWLQRLALPRVGVADLALRRLRDAEEGWSTVMSILRSDEDRERIALFDATSDLGVPTVLSVLAPAAGSGLPYAVGAACSDSGWRAVLKALRELTVVRACSVGACPDLPAEAFSQLFATEAIDAGRALGVGAEPTGTVAQRLARIVTAIARRSREIVAVELTPVELDGAGVRVVRVIAPGLIPYLASPSVRYLATPRLYEAPRRMGFRVLPESEVNPWPSPLT